MIELVCSLKCNFTTQETWNRARMLRLIRLYEQIITFYNFFNLKTKISLFDSLDSSNLLYGSEA